VLPRVKRSRDGRALILTDPEAVTVDEASFDLSPRHITG
jgi:hypothetical protein